MHVWVLTYKDIFFNVFYEEEAATAYAEALIDRCREEGIQFTIDISYDNRKSWSNERKDRLNLIKTQVI